MQILLRGGEEIAGLILCWIECEPLVRPLSLKKGNCCFIQTRVWTTYRRHWCKRHMGIKDTSAPALKRGLIRKCMLDTLLMRDTSCKETRIAPLCMSLIKEFNCISSTASTQNITSNDTSWHEASWELPRQNRWLDFSGAATNPTLWVRSVTVEERGCRVLTAYEWRAQLMWAKSSAPLYDVTTKVSGIASLRCEKAACSCNSHTARYNRTRHENSGPYLI